MIDVVITGLERVQAMVDPVVFEMKLSVAIDLRGQRADRADRLGDPVGAIRRGLTVDGAGPAREDCVITDRCGKPEEPPCLPTPAPSPQASGTTGARTPTVKTPSSA